MRLICILERAAHVAEAERVEEQRAGAEQDVRARSPIRMARNSPLPAEVARSIVI